MPTDNTEYLKLDEDIARQIEEDQAHHRVNEYRCPDVDIIRRDNSRDRASLTRPAFVRDIEKILNIPAYNRYADKTQVFSFTKNDDICRRGLHVQLVARVARGIGRILGLNLDLIEAIALGHDTGHTPFGHAGERYLNTCYYQRTGKYFNHNVHSVRVLDYLYQRNISLQTLNGVLCHNGEFAQQTLKMTPMNNFEELDKKVQECIDDEQTIATLRPSTLEGCVVRVSDMIAYIGKDRQDAIEFGLLDSLDCFESDYLGVQNTTIIHNMTVDIINHSYGHEYISMSDAAFKDLKRAKRENYENIYLHEGVMNGSSNVVETMFQDLYEKLLYDLRNKNEDSPIYVHHIDALVKKSHNIKREDYLMHDYDRIVVDYLASMTDSYFIALYQFLFPNSSNTVTWNDYFADLREKRTKAQRELA